MSSDKFQNQFLFNLSHHSTLYDLPLQSYYQSKMSKNVTVSWISRYTIQNFEIGCFFLLLGIELIEHCNGDVSIRNRSWSCSVFVQSILYNRLNGLNDSTVYHLQRRQSIHSIFNSSIFTQLVNDPLGTYESILDLTKLCTIKVSYKYGWGYDFGQREITSTPCWLSILINEPLRLIDARLQRLQPQQATTSS